MKKMLSNSIILQKLENAFSGNKNIRFNEKKSYFSFVIAKRATIYIDKQSKKDIAKIRSTAILNFPNGDKLKNLLYSRGVVINDGVSHPDYLIGLADIDSVIEIIMMKLNASYTIISNCP